ncbi:MAG: hypothetical protein ABIJ45_07550 [Candidatus Zixiibacteriota bacterium]
MNITLKIISIFLIAGFIINSSLSAGDLSLSVYPSEDELYEAFLLNEIDYSTYLKLVEIFQDGVDSTEIFLLKEMPNVEYFLESFIKDHSEYEIEQADALVSQDLPAKKITGFLRVNRKQIIKENGTSQGYAFLKTKFGENWTFSGKISEYADGHESVNNRAFTYKSANGKISKAVIGNYNAEFGLGLLVGYHGRIFSADDESIGNTILFPEYGGYNGLYLQGSSHRDEVRLILHYNQNDSLSVRIGAIDLAQKIGRWRFDFMVLTSALRNRELNTEYRATYFGGSIRYKTKSFSTAAETMHSSESKTFLPAGIIETKYKNDNFNIGLTAWHYADDLIDFATGSRVGTLEKSIEIDSIDYKYSDNRINQNGILLKTRAIMENSTAFSFSFQTYGDQSTKILKNIISCEVPLSNYSQLRFDFEGYNKKDGIEDIYENKVRTGFRYKYNNLYYRGYLGYNDNRTGPDYISFFSRGSFKTVNYGKIEGWLNWAKIDPVNKTLDYFYGFIKESFDLGSTLEMSAKYSYRYSRSGSESRIIFEAKVAW